MMRTHFDLIALLLFTPVIRIIMYHLPLSFIYRTHTYKCFANDDDIIEGDNKKRDGDG